MSHIEIVSPIEKCSPILTEKHYCAYCEIVFNIEIGNKTEAIRIEKLRSGTGSSIFCPICGFDIKDEIPI